jgi:hypothetical protein
MLARKSTRDNFQVEALAEFGSANWVEVYPHPVSWLLANQFAMSWKKQGFTTMVKDCGGGWVVYVKWEKRS